MGDCSVWFLARANAVEQEHVFSQIKAIILILHANYLRSIGRDNRIRGAITVLHQVHREVRLTSGWVIGIHQLIFVWIKIGHCCRAFALEPGGGHKCIRSAATANGIIDAKNDRVFLQRLDKFFLARCLGNYRFAARERNNGRKF